MWQRVSVDELTLAFLAKCLSSEREGEREREREGGRERERVRERKSE